VNRWYLYVTGKPTQLGHTPKIITVHVIYLIFLELKSRKLRGVFICKWMTRNEYAILVEKLHEEKAIWISKRQQENTWMLEK
jgi:hypothetical protein